MAQALPPLFLLSACQGWLQSRGRSRAWNQLSAAPVPVHPLVDLPADFPRELLEDTEEGRRLEEQEAERALLQAQHAEAEEAEPHLPVVELMGCWRLTAAQHTALLQRVLLPLAAKHASVEVLQALGPQCSAAFHGVVAGGAEAGGSGSESPSSSGQGGLLMWTAPSLVELAAGGAAAPATEAAVPQQAAPVLALLQVLGQAPVTILTPETIPFANETAPWDQADVVYLTSSGGAAAGGRQRDPQGAAGGGLVRLRRRIASLVQGDDWEGHGQAVSIPAEADLVDAAALQGVLCKAVEVRRL